MHGGGILSMSKVDVDTVAKKAAGFDKPPPSRPVACSPY